MRFLSFEADHSLWAMPSWPEAVSALHMFGGGPTVCSDLCGELTHMMVMTGTPSPWRSCSHAVKVNQTHEIRGSFRKIPKERRVPSPEVKCQILCKQITLHLAIRKRKNVLALVPGGKFDEINWIGDGLCRMCLIWGAGEPHPPNPAPRPCLSSQYTIQILSFSLCA